MSQKNIVDNIEVSLQPKISSQSNTTNNNFSTQTTMMSTPIPKNVSSISKCKFTVYKKFLNFFFN